MQVAKNSKRRPKHSWTRKGKRRQEPETIQWIKFTDDGYRLVELPLGADLSALDLPDHLPTLEESR
jgi:hypothetical protein